MTRPLLLDLDGVLVDSQATQERLWTEWATRRGIDPKPLLAAHGLTAWSKVRELTDLDPHEAVPEIDAMEIADTEGVTAYPGAHELLLSGRRIAIVTSASRRLALARLQAAGLPVTKHIVAAETVMFGKPDPTPYLTGADLLGVRAEDCDVVEDSRAGVEAGEAARARVIGLTTTVGEGELRKAGAHHVFASLREYLRWEAGR